MYTVLLTDTSQPGKDDQTSSPLVVAYKARVPLTLADHPVLLQTMGLRGAERKLWGFDWKKGTWRTVALDQPMWTDTATSIVLTTGGNLRVREEFTQIIHMAESGSLHNYPVVVLL